MISVYCYYINRLGVLLANLEMPTILVARGFIMRERKRKTVTLGAHEASALAPVSRDQNVENQLVPRE